MFWEKRLDSLLRRVVKVGRLEVEYPSGTVISYGSGEISALFKITAQSTVKSLVMDPELAFGEAYMKGDITVREDELYIVVSILFQNVKRFRKTKIGKLTENFRMLTQKHFNANSIARSSSNARRHYDVDERLYRLFLDDDLQYSCAYFERPEVSLEDAQSAKNSTSFQS